MRIDGKLSCCRNWFRYLSCHYNKYGSRFTYCTTTYYIFCRHESCSQVGWSKDGL